MEEVVEKMEADFDKANGRKRSLPENLGFSVNSDSFSLANIVQDDFVEESRNSYVGTLEIGKDAVQIFSKTRSMIKNKSKFQKRMEKLDSSECSDEAQTEKQPDEVGLDNIDQTNIVSSPTLSDEGNSEENIDSFNVKENFDASLAISIPSITQTRKKLLVLDLNGLLADIHYTPPKNYTPDAYIAGRAIFKRPNCDAFLKFCFEKFEVGIWSSRNRNNVEKFIDFLMGDMKHKLLFSWDSSYCTATRFNIPGQKFKPLVFKDLRKLWEKYDPDLPWERRDYNESNTLLIDDSPHKALLNPPHTAIFPHSFKFDMNDTSLGEGGDLKVYMERLASADNIQKFVEENPFGQTAITERSEDWRFYRHVIDTCLQSKLGNNVGLAT